MKKIFIIILIFSGLSGTLMSAENSVDNMKPGISIGINGNYGTFDLYNSDMDLETKPGLYAGGGITIEKTVYGVLGFGSGFQYRYFNTDFVMEEDTIKYDATWTFQTINIPFLLILTFSGDEKAVSLSCGAVYSHIFSSVMTTDEIAGLDKSEDDVMRFTNTNQIGLAGGISFKFGVTRFTDFVVGITGEFYPTNLLYNVGDSGEKLNMYNYSITTGYMFRTNVFPGSE